MSLDYGAYEEIELRSNGNYLFMRLRTVYRWSNRWQVWTYVGISNSAKRRMT